MCIYNRLNVPVSAWVMSGMGVCVCVCDVRKYVDGVSVCVGTALAVGTVVDRSSGRRITIHKSFLKSGT